MLCLLSKLFFKKKKVSQINKSNPKAQAQANSIEIQLEGPGPQRVYRK